VLESGDRLAFVRTVAVRACRCGVTRARSRRARRDWLNRPNHHRRTSSSWRRRDGPSERTGPRSRTRYTYSWQTLYPTRHQIAHQAAPSRRSSLAPTAARIILDPVLRLLNSNRATGVARSRSNLNWASDASSTAKRSCCCTWAALEGPFASQQLAGSRTTTLGS